MMCTPSPIGQYAVCCMFMSMHVRNHRYIAAPVPFVPPPCTHVRPHTTVEYEVILIYLAEVDSRTRMVVMEMSKE